MKAKVLLQIDSDEHPSSFDSIVAIDSGVDRLLSYGGVSVDQVTGLIHGGMFTRGPKDLCCTAAFFGGSDVAETTRLFEQAKKCFFGPVRISMMADPNGANTTAVAAVLCARRHMSFEGQRVVVLGGTGPVGRRVATLIAAQGGQVCLVSRNEERAAVACDEVRAVLGADAELEPMSVCDSRSAVAVLSSAAAVFAAGAAGVELLHESWLESASHLKVAVDLNAVPPVGISQIGVTDAGDVRQGVVCYGAIGVGGLKMKIHRESLQSLFASNEVLLDLDEIYQVGTQIEAS